MPYEEQATIFDHVLRRLPKVMLPSDSQIPINHAVFGTNEKGVPCVVARRTRGADGQERHGDSAVAFVMAYPATKGRAGGSMDKRVFAAASPVISSASTVLAEVR